MTDGQHPPNALVDGAPTRLDQCVWIGRSPCGCIVTVTIAHVQESWSLPTADAVRAHLAEGEPDWRKALLKRIDVELVTADTYQQSSLTCKDHTL